MNIRQMIRDRKIQLKKIAAKAKEKEDEATMLDCLIRQDELDLLLRELRKKNK